MDGTRLRRRIRSFFAPKVRQAPFVVLTLEVPWGFTPESYRAVCERLEQESAAWSNFYNPRSMTVFFEAGGSGEARASSWREAVESLGAQHECMQRVRVGQAKGELLATFDRRGRVTSSPMGGAVLEALRQMA